MATTATDDVSSYAEDPGLGRGSQVFITIKGFNQQAIVDKIIARKGQKSLGLTAVSDPSERSYSSGRIAFTTLDVDGFDDAGLASFDGIDCVEPYHLEARGDQVAFTAGDRFELAGAEGRRSYHHPWMAYLHTVDFSADGRRVLTVSTGFDTVQEIDLTTGELVWDWNAWDHGYTYAERINTHFVRNRNQAERLQAEHPNATVTVVDPARWPPEGLATQQTPMNMNSVFYDDGRVLATGYHRPELFVIDRDLHAAFDLGLSHPHSFRPLRTPYHQGFMVANTGAGQLILVDESMSPVRVIDVGNLPADKTKKAGFGEWLQTVAPLDAEAGLFLAVDALRSGVHVLDVVGRRRRFISNPANWTVQTVAPISPVARDLVLAAHGDRAAADGP